MRHAKSIRSGGPASLSKCLLWVAAAACGSDAADTPHGAEASAADRPAAESPRSSPSGDIEVLGTIRATVDGAARTWYVVDGQAKRGRYASAVWHAPEEDERMLNVGAYDTERPPLHTFDVEADDRSFGEYEGSTIGIIFSVPNGAGSLSADLADPGAEAALLYMPVATFEMSGVYFADEGSLEVSELSFEDGKARLTGRFEGLLLTPEGAGPIRIEDGRLEVAGIPSSEELVP